MFLCILEDLGKCPNGWLERSGSDKCYLFTSGRDSLSWDDAKRSCMLKQGHLVDINSVNERVRRFINDVAVGSNIRASVLFNLLNELEKAINRFFATSLINSIILDHEFYILFIT